MRTSRRLGAIEAATLSLASLPADAIKPWVAGYLRLVGGMILIKAFRGFVPRQVTTYVAPLGAFGALIDAVGGGAGVRSWPAVCWHAETRSASPWAASTP